MNTIGMVGLGAMGRSVADHLLTKGFPMIVYDVRPEAAADFVARGAETATDLPELGRRADCILMMVNSFPQCKSVLEGLLQTMNHGVIINLGTIAMHEAQQLAQMAAQHGVSMLDCPVSGGTAGAKAGTLTLMAAGSDAVLTQCRPVLEAFSTNLFHVGDQPGQGQAVKAINQLLVGVHMCATAEAFTLAKQCGLDLEQVYQVICKSAGMSRIFENRGRFVIGRNFDTRSTLQIQLKDTNIVCDTAAEVGAPTFLANTARELFKLAVRKYPPTDDSLEVIRLYEELCGTQE